MSHYLTGRTPIGTVATLKFAEIFEVHPTEIRPDFQYTNVSTSELPADVLKLATRLAMFNKEVRHDVEKTVEALLERGNYPKLLDNLLNARKVR